MLILCITHNVHWIYTKLHIISRCKQIIWRYIRYKKCLFWISICYKFCKSSQFYSRRKTIYKLLWWVCFARLNVWFCSEKKLHYILDSTILKLLADNNTNLITTVKYYLDYNENLNLIAEKLGIHYNTLKYRIEKLKTKYFIDLKNSDSLIKLRLAIVALEISEGYKLDLGLNWKEGHYVSNI